jgi:hypothetical protein|tara:strand:+ start:270 stop:881 length:612 start_codon:yes stop_codon:yes gene_type:complete
MATFAERNITNFRDRLVGGGARPNLFEVNIELPDGVIGQADYRDDVRFMVKAAEIPAANIGNIPVPFRGRVLPVAGDRTFDPWTVTVINDSKFNIRDAMEQWSNKINDLQFDVGDISPSNYQTKAEVFQLSRGGKTTSASSTGGETINVLRTYNFEGIYPSVVSSIPLDYGATDSIEEFQVTFNYLFWTVGNGLPAAPAPGTT